MHRQRPAVITTFGILNIVFGVLGLVCMICIGFGLLAFASIASSTPQDQAIFPPFPAKAKSYYSITLGLSSVTSVLLIVAGIGLLGMKVWARWLSIGYGGFTVLFSLICLVAQLTVVNPAMEQWNRDFAQQFQRRQQEVQRQGGAVPFAPVAQPQSSASNTVYSIMGTFISIAYGVALLVVMFLPSVAQAFEGRPRRRLRRDEEYEEEDEEDEEEDRPRRRRRSEEYDDE